MNENPLLAVRSMVNDEDICLMQKMMATRCRCLEHKVQGEAARQKSQPRSPLPPFS